MEMKHSPGPWAVFFKADGGNFRHVNVMSDEGPVCITEWRGSVNKTNANAQLIAAAPDMLEVLQNCLDCDLGPGNNWVKYKIRAAIAKADGRLQDSQKLTELAYEAYCDEALK